MRRLVRLQPSDRLPKLSLRADAPAAVVLVPGDRDVDEALVEVALLRRRGAPRELELFVRLEPPPGAKMLDPELVRVTHGFYGSPRGDDPALWGRPLLPREARGPAP